MITQTTLFCILSKDDFDPDPFLSYDQFDMDYHRRGDISKRSGMVFTSGGITLSSKNEDIDNFLNDLYSIRGLIAESDNGNRVLYVLLGYEDQCNWDFSLEELRMIVEMGFVLAVSCSKMTREDLAE